MTGLPTFDYSKTAHIPDDAREAARRRLAAKRAALIIARQNHPTESIYPAMMTMHYETALQFLQDLDAGRLGVGLSIEARAGALAVVLAAATAGAKAAVEESGADPDLDVVRRHAESIADVCAHAYDAEASVAASVNAARWAHGGALSILRLLGASPPIGGDT